MFKTGDISTVNIILYSCFICNCIIVILCVPRHVVRVNKYIMLYYLILFPLISIGSRYVLMLPSLEFDFR